MSKKINLILNEGETLLNTSKASLNKALPFIANTIFSSAKFVATGIPSHSKRKKIDRSLLEIYLSLTNKRLLIWKTTWYGQPKELWLSIDLNQIKKVELKFTKIFWELPSIKIELYSGEKINFWSAKIYKRRTTNLITKLKELISNS
ncbi:hypothetical protein FRY74_04565 [Vicingus serpentipes]|uniref:Uncharacterized protein n=1 Tax=Vicingus serpentipes TaxID=1926625 RepID=A0A5C6RTP2_9FLAO|nr:hypothetical protein [Vicingus serpentipes]TXB65846.1 hypothetical protein FRY74_04565 [Vicingus serpentipes]